MNNNLKMEIVLDEEKITRDGRYNITELYGTISDKFEEYKLEKTDIENDGITYRGVGTFYEESWKFAVILLWLEKNTDYVQFMRKWIWHISEHNQEDVLEQILSEDKKIAWVNG